MKITETIILNEKQKLAVFKLWNEEYPERLNHQKISELDDYFSNLTDQKHFFLTSETGEIFGWAFTFVRDNQKWFAMILESKTHRQGYGTFLLNKLKNNENKLSGWVIDHNQAVKVNGENYRSPLQFYLKNNFEIVPSIRLELDEISAVKINWISTKTISRKS